MSDERRSRGRPCKDTVHDSLQPHSPQWIARAVFQAEAEFGLKPMQAVDLVMKNLGLPAAHRGNVKRYATRHKDLRDVVFDSHRLWRLHREIGSAASSREEISRDMRRRMADFSDPVLRDHKGVLSLPFFGFHKFLVAQSIDGNLPAWFVECVHANRDVRGRELLRLLERAASKQA